MVSRHLSSSSDVAPEVSPEAPLHTVALESFGDPTIFSHVALIVSLDEPESTIGPQTFDAPSLPTKEPPLLDVSSPNANEDISSPSPLGAERPPLAGTRIICTLDAE